MDGADLLLAALAMGLGWGIRGQFGHESGAMVPGAMVGCALALAAGAEPTTALRLAALGALGCAVGGAMTYGQTVGLVLDRPCQKSLGWGLLGLAVKGGGWIGLTGAVLTLITWPAANAAVLLVVMSAAAALGVAGLNRPHRPPAELPRIYFSRRDDPKPRPEVWGGVWLAVGVAAAAFSLGGPAGGLELTAGGIVGGAVGFALGGLLQYAGRHHRPLGEWGRTNIDWWKVMEVGFGACAGLGLAVGWARAELPVADLTLPLAVELPLLVAWLAWLLAAELVVPRANRLWERPVLAIVVPVALVLAGRVTPVLLVGPVLFWLSGDNLVRQAVREKLAKPAEAWAVLTVATVAVAAVCAQADGAGWWLCWLAWSQTALTVAWCCARSEVRGAGSPAAAWQALRGARWTELAFIGLATAISVLACR